MHYLLQLKQNTAACPSRGKDRSLKIFSAISGFLSKFKIFDFNQMFFADSTRLIFFLSVVIVKPENYNRIKICHELNTLHMSSLAGDDGR